MNYYYVAYTRILLFITLDTLPIQFVFYYFFSLLEIKFLVSLYRCILVVLVLIIGIATVYHICSASGWNRRKISEEKGNINEVCLKSYKKDEGMMIEISNSDKSEVTEASNEVRTQREEHNNDSESDNKVTMPKISPIREKLRNALLAFSVKKNGESLFSTDEPDGSFSCLNGIRFLSMAWIMLGHLVGTSSSSILAGMSS